MKKHLILTVLLLAFAGRAEAAVLTEDVEYADGSVVLQGYLAYDNSRTGPFVNDAGKRPGILIVHEWKGLNSYTKRRAVQLASLGYVAFAADMYGKGVVAKDHEEAGKLSGIYRKDRQLTRRRILAAYEQLKGNPLVDPEKIGAIGYCFGAMVVIELARAGTDVKGIAVFHGGVDVNPADDKNIKAKLVFFQGAEDPHVNKEQMEEFRKEMEALGVDCKVIYYPGAVHSFTVSEAGSDPSKGAAYNKQADEISWLEMRKFFGELFAPKPEVK